MMDGCGQFHPLDKLIADHSFSFLEALVPFVDYPFKKPLVLFIKYQELMAIFHALDNRPFLSECGFDCHPSGPEDMLHDMCRFLPPDYADSIRQMSQMMKMMQMMNMAESQDMHKGNSYAASGMSPQVDRYPEDETDLYESVLSILDGDA